MLTHKGIRMEIISVKLREDKLKFKIINFGGITHEEK